MNSKSILWGCLILAIGIAAGSILPHRIIRWQIGKQVNHYFTDNDVSLPFQTFTKFTYENIIANAAPWAKEFLTDELISGLEQMVHEKYAYRFEASARDFNSHEAIIDYFNATGLLKELTISADLAHEKLGGIVPSQTVLVPKSTFTRAFMSDRPEGPVRMPAEFEPIHSVFVSFPIMYPSQWKTHLELMRAISREAIVNVLVPNEYWHKAVLLYCIQQGVSLENILFMYVKSDDVWTRDYGPTTVIDKSGEKCFIWNNYYEEYTSFAKHSADAAGDLGRYFDIPVFRVPLVVEGGNIITDGAGTFIMFNSVLTNNPDYDLPKLKQVMKDYYGCTNLILLPALEDELTGHVDMVVKFIDKRTLMVIESDKSYKWYQHFETIAKTLSATRAEMGNAGSYHDVQENTRSSTNDIAEPGNYKVIRIRMPQTDNDSVNFWSYVNSLTLNGAVIVPQFGVPEDQLALDTYRKAMPQYKIEGINFSNYPVGSVHCQTKEMSR